MRVVKPNYVPLMKFRNHNFLKFTPGLVGGHCIGVDPYYLTYKAMQLGYSPNLILSGRKVNDEMGSEVAKILLKEMVKNAIVINSSKILIMGFAFKKNCPDIRNTGVINVHKELIDFGCEVSIYDPLVDKEKAAEYYNRAVKNHLTGKLSLAIADYNAAIEANPELGQARCNLGLIYNQRHEYDKAISEFRKALAINPKDAFTYNGIGAALRAQKDYDGALKNWQTATSLKPDLATAHYNLGTVYEIKKDPDNIYKFLPNKSAKAFDLWKKIVQKII